MRRYQSLYQAKFASKNNYFLTNVVVTTATTTRDGVKARSDKAKAKAMTIEAKTKAMAITSEAKVKGNDMTPKAKDDF